MHPVLHIAEILDLIVTHCQDEDYPNIALTCRVFCEPIMDQRWSKLMGMRALVCCLPEEVLDTVDVLGQPVIRIAKVPSAEHWRRFQYYAHRVREFDLYDPKLNPHQGVDDSCYDILRQHYPERRLFPGLRAFRCLHRSVLRWADLFVQPYLRLADFSIYADEDITALGLLASNAPELEELKISFTFSSMRSPAVITSISQTICALNHLREILFTAAILQDALRHLSTLPQLTNLSIYLDESNCVPLDTDGTTIGLFPALKHLFVGDRRKDGDTSHMIHWLRGIRPPSLHFLSVQTVTSASSMFLGELLSVIATYTTLHELNLVVAYPENTNAAPDPVPEDDFRPLIASLHDIRKFECVNVPLDWSGPFLREVASAWPNLVDLSLGDCWRESSRIQVCDLAPFAQLCPALNQLSLAVSPHMPDSLSPTNETPSSLRVLLLGNAPFDHAAVPRIAAFLDALFPLALLDIPSRMYYAASHSDMLRISIRAINSMRRRMGGRPQNASFGTSFIAAQ